MKKFKTVIITSTAIIFCIILFSIGALQNADYKFYDFLLSLRKSPVESKNLLLVEADNIALEHIGPWPWKRDVYADMLLRMKELGAQTAVFDIEYLSPSNFPECDQYFSRAIQFFGNTYLTINTKELDIEYSNDDIDYANSRFLFDVTGKKDEILFGNRITAYETVHDTTRGFSKIDWNDKKSFEDLAMGFSPAMNLFVSRAKGAGFTNIVIDKDGVRRRVELLSYQESLNKSVAQLVLSPLLAQLEPDSIIRTKNSLILKGAHLSNPKSQSSSDQITKDIKIPLDQYGRMLINWNHAKYKDAFRAESILFLNTMDRIEENIYAVLQNLVIEFEDWSKEKYDAEIAKNYQKQAALLCQNYSEILEFKEFLLSICDGYDIESNAINGGIPQEYYDQYFSLRKQYFNDVTLFSAFNQLSALIKPEELQQTWDTLTHEINLYNDMFNEKSKIYKDAFCIIGQTASSTTDLGITPFERAYPNIGTHANVYNTIINHDFITPLNGLWGILIAALLTLAMTYFTEKKKPLVQNLAGILSIALIFVIPLILMRAGGIYLPSSAPLLISLTSYIAITILRFTTAEKGRRFLKTTFGAYVAPAIVDQIVKNPELANLGGKSEYLTALFSDVKTFSGFTEVINNEEGEEKGAERLVEILNEYLGALSNAIMDHNGTIDK
ncbi:CHASE2 domain-containing protein, partial [Treponema sp.]|uniref:CHASE2 domain-containing protein n=1 Tax=Treponema sp. TaxID=166 RepID=UPI00298DCBA3